MMYGQSRSRELYIYVGAFCGLVLSKGLSLVPALGLDDYNAIHQDRNPLFYIWQGRFTQALIQLLLTELGVSPTSIGWPVILLFFAFCALAITLGILYVADGRGRAPALASVAALIGAHPYLTEYFTFRESLITQGMSFALAAAALSFITCITQFGDRGHRIRYICLMLVLVLLAGAQQTAFIVVAFFVLARAALDWMERDPAGRASRGKQNQLAFAAIALAGALYVLIYLLARNISAAPLDPRSAIISSDAIPARLGAIIDLTRKVLFADEPIISGSLKNYLLSIFAIALIVVAFSSVRRALTIAVVMATLYAGSIALVSISGIWWPVPRAMYGIGFAIGISLLLLHASLKDALWPYFAAAVAVCAIGFCFHSNALLYDQIRLNRWDAWVASSLANEFIADGISAEERVVLVGADWTHAMGPKTNDRDLNTSALAVSWAANHLFMEATGRRWNIESVREANECQGVTPWPSRNAFRKVDGAVYVCMGKQ